MSLETRVNGLTAWANFRLQIVGHDVMKNILAEFMDGYNMKILVESKSIIYIVYDNLHTLEVSIETKI